METEKELLEINVELKRITERIEKALTAFDGFEETQTMKQKDASISKVAVGKAYDSFLNRLKTKAEIL